jgi:tyrosine-protein phosphatase SIW14
MYNVLVCLALLLFSISGFSQNSNVRPSDWAVKIENQRLKNLYKLNDTIFRCEQPDSLGFLVLDSLKIKSILNLRSEHTDKQLTDNLSLTLYQVNMRAKQFDNKEIIESLKILIKAPKPIIVHCKYGSDRTGIVLAMYRIIFQHWTKEQAINELRNGEYGFHEYFKNIPDYINNCDIKELKKQILN